MMKFCLGLLMFCFACVLIPFHSAIAGASGTTNNVTGSAGWTENVSWTVSDPDANGIVTISWTTPTGKHGSGEVRGNSDVEVDIGGGGNGDVTFYLTQNPPGVRWGTVSAATDVGVT